MHRGAIPFRYRGLWIVCAAILLCALAAPLLPTPSAHANSITVNTTADTLDPTKCSLRAAIVAANLNVPFMGCTGGLGADTINFNLPVICHVTACVVLLNSPLPVVTQDLTINGAGVPVDGNNLYVVFGLKNSLVSFNSLTIRNGRGDFGGGIVMTSTTLILNNVTVSGNHAHSAAAVYLFDGALYVNQSQFLGNLAETNGFGGAVGMAVGFAVIANSTFTGNSGGSGGAIGALGNANLDVIASVFEGNAADIWGGAFYLQDQTVRARIASSVITDNLTANTGVGFGGGGIYSANASLWMTGTTLANNLSAARGGGLGVFGSPITLTNVTISGNSARDHGGGIYAQTDNPFSSPLFLTLDNATLTGNTADSDLSGIGNGGGIFVLTGTATMLNSIIAGNFDTPNNSGAGTKHPDCSGTYTVSRFTLIGRNDGCTGFVNGSDGNRVGTAGSPLDPLLAPLTNNGGPLAGMMFAAQPVPTHALLSLSPAINAGDPAAPGSSALACDLFDQRGIRRPLGAHCDMGAFEAGGYVWLPVVLR